MKKLLLSLFSLILISLAACQQAPAPKATEVIFTTQTDSKIPLKSLAGKWVVINFWASWCKPCYEEIPALNAFAKKFQDKALVLGVSYDHVQDDQLPALIAKMNIQFTTLKYDPSQALGVETLAGIPATLIINPAGKLVETLYGEQTEASLEKAIA